MLLVTGLFLLCTGLTSRAENPESTLVQDWITLNWKVQTPHSPSSGYVSGYGYLKHVSSGRYILPDNGECPKNGNFIRIGDHSVNNANKFRFVQASGHIGFIEQYCGKVVHPDGGSTNPGDATNLEMHDDRHSGAHFFFDEEQDHIVHIGTKIFHPKGGSHNPGKGTEMVLHKDLHDSARFQFVSAEGAESVYPPPSLSGRWEVVFAVLDPISEHTYSVKYTVGKSITKQANAQVTWKTSETTTMEWYQKNEELSYYASIAQSATWSVEVERTYSVTVYPGKTSVTWQYIFCAERLDEGYCFRSTILGDTDNLNKPPNI